VKKKVYSGIRATGRLHLGNYFGAVKGMLALQEEYDCIFSVVDLHAITTPYDPKNLAQSTRDVILDYLAAGLDPEKCLLEVQSFVPEHVELAYYLGTIFPVAQLEDLPTYKEKKTQHPKYVNMGLLYYPVLMAADVLLYKGELVPVGIDQEPHLEIMRQIARKFNGMFGQTFPEPQRFKTEGEYVPSLLGQGKMSKTVEGSYINLTDDLEIISAKIAKIPTDSGRGTVSEADLSKGDKLARYINESGQASPGVAALMELVALFEGREKQETYNQQYQNEGLRYSEVKQELAQAIYKQLKPIQEKRHELEADITKVDVILREHTHRCRERAQETIREVKSKMGFLSI
jgi:tryptophanyl-tRNA synthetase